MTFRTCNKCKIEKPLDSEYFFKRSLPRAGEYFTTCRECENKRSRDKYKKYIDRERLRGKLKNRRYKETVMGAYGGICTCCGESELAFLSIDHINGDGGWHRKNKTQGNNLYTWLIKNNFPEGFQVLCYNCNWAKSRAGGCPHKNKTAS